MSAGAAPAMTVPAEAVGFGAESSSPSAAPVATTGNAQSAEV